VIQQGQVFKLKARCADREPLWAYRYRVAGRGSARLQVGGFGSRAEAQRALQHRLARLVPGRRSVTITLGEWVAEYLEAHQGERVTVAKLRWLLGKATAELGGVRLAELSPEQVCAWRLIVPEGHRFEATQALRQLLNRAVAWQLIDDNPAKRGVPNPARRCREQRPFDSWPQIRSLAERLGPTFGPMVVFAAATGLRPSELFALEQGDVDRRRRRPDLTRVCERRSQAPQDAAEQTRGSLAGDRARGARPATAAFSEPAALPERTRRLPRLPQLQPAPVEARPAGSRDRAAARPLRPAPHLRHLRAPRRRPVFALSRFMGTSIAMIDLHYGHLAVDSYQHAVSLLDALALERAVDAGWTPARKPAKPRGAPVSRPRESVSRRAVDARWTSKPRQLATGPRGRG
jgi:integrase